MDREELLSNRYDVYLEQQTDLGLASIFYNTMSKLIDRDFGVKEFVRRDELTNIIKELDYTGKLDVSGFEDIRNNAQKGE